MEFAEIINAIVQVGFPVIVALFFLYRLALQDKRHADQYDQLQTALNNNTKVISELCYLVKDLKDEVEQK